MFLKINYFAVYNTEWLISLVVNKPQSMKVNKKYFEMLKRAINKKHYVKKIFSREFFLVFS